MQKVECLKKVYNCRSCLLIDKMLLNLMHSPLLMQSTLLMLLVAVYCINSSDASPQMELESGRIKDAIILLELTFALTHMLKGFTVYLCFCRNSLSLFTSIQLCLIIIFLYIATSKFVQYLCT